MGLMASGSLIIEREAEEISGGAFEEIDGGRTRGVGDGALNL